MFKVFNCDQIVIELSALCVTRSIYLKHMLSEYKSIIP